eukprot:664238-Heterocapsa_arctica.AAC.1
MGEVPDPKRQCVGITQEWLSDFVQNVENRFVSSVKIEINGVKEAVTACSATAQQALEEARRVGERQEKTEDKISELASKISAVEKEVKEVYSANADGDVPMAEAQRVPRYKHPGVGAERVPTARGSARSTAGSSASTAATVGQAKAMIVMGGWPRDTPRMELEAHARAVFQKYQDELMSCPEFVDMSAPFVRGST